MIKGLKYHRIKAMEFEKLETTGQTNKILIIFVCHFAQEIVKQVEHWIGTFHQTFRIVELH